MRKKKISKKFYCMKNIVDIRIIIDWQRIPLNYLKMAKKVKQTTKKQSVAPSKSKKVSKKQEAKKEESQDDDDIDELNQDTLKFDDDSEGDEDSDFADFASTDDEADDSDSDSESENEEKSSKNASQKDEQKTIKKNQKQQIAHTVTPVNKKNLKKGKKSDNDSNKKNKRGIMYVGRLPEGFDEPELEKYFTQFGNIVNLRVSRNRKTGKSKHYGFIEFENYEVAKIAQETMNNYMLFNRLLKCQLIEEQEGEEENEKLLQLFKNNKKSFKKIPWAKISKRNFEKPKSVEKWAKLKAKHDGKANLRAEKLKEAGFNFDLVN